MNSSVMNSLSASDVFVHSGPVTGFQLYFQQASIAPMAASKLWRVMDQGDRSAWVSKSTALMPSAGKKTKKFAAKKKKPVAGGSASRKVPKVTGTKKATAAKKKPVSGGSISRKLSEVAGPKKATVKELRQLLEARNLSTQGKKQELAARLAEALSSSSSPGKENIDSPPLSAAKTKPMVSFTKNTMLGTAQSNYDRSSIKVSTASNGRRQTRQTIRSQPGVQVVQAHTHTATGSKEDRVLVSQVGCADAGNHAQEVVAAARC
jgi:hypothetical protein